MRAIRRRRARAAGRAGLGEGMGGRIYAGMASLLSRARPRTGPCCLGAVLAGIALDDRSLTSRPPMRREHVRSPTGPPWEACSQVLVLAGHLVRRIACEYPGAWPGREQPRLRPAWPWLLAGRAAGRRRHPGI